MVGKVNLSKRQLKNLYFKVKEKTNNFKEIGPAIIAENCQSLVVFRLALGLPVKDFAKICKRSNGSIDNLQKCSKKINFGIAEYYTKIIKKFWDSADIQWKNISEKYDCFYGRAIKGIKILPKTERIKFSKIGSKKALEKRKKNDFLYFKASRKGIEKQGLTKQEEKVQRLLSKNSIEYETHKFLYNENVDFLIYGKILIGCVAGKQKNLTHHARRLMHQAYRIKYHNKNLIYVGILGNDFENLKIEDVSIGAIKLLNEVCDKWFVDENINQLISFIVALNLQAHQAKDQ